METITAIKWNDRDVCDYGARIGMSISASMSISGCNLVHKLVQKLASSRE